MNKKIVIATHYLVYGAPQALREYLISQKIKKLYFIGHPLQVDQTKSFRELIVDGDVKFNKKSKLRVKCSVCNYFIELFLSIFWFLRDVKRCDIWIGVDSLNAVCGIFLKKIGLVDRVIFYTIDYVPSRFQNKLLNDTYHRIDRFCLDHVDEVWNVSYRIAEGREKERGLSRERYKNQKIVPIGVWYDRVKRAPFEERKKHQLLFVGNLLEKQGVQLVLEAMPEILKEIPDFHFLVVGGGEYEDVLKKMVDDMNLKSRVTFTGWIKERSELDNIMKDSAVAIAMYDKEKDFFTYYADPTKLKDYLSAGLPILLTDVPHNAHEIQDEGCGVIVKYDKNDIVKAIIKIMSDEKGLREYHDNALRYIKQFDWSLIFKKNL